jgi:hypothetical protein
MQAILDPSRDQYIRKQRYLATQSWKMVDISKELNIKLLRSEDQ